MSFKNIKKHIGKWHKKTKLIWHYSKYFSSKQQESKERIVVCFDGVFPHGGLVDRLKGIVSFYQIAKELNYDFYILFNHPFHLEALLEPNGVDWKFHANQIKWHPFKTKLLYLINDFDTNPLQTIKYSNAKTFYVYANVDYSKSMFPHLSIAELESKWRNDFNGLFKKSKLLNAKINDISIGNYIAFHTRFTSIMGDFKDTTNHVLSENEKQELQKKLLSAMVNKAEEAKKQAYVFSDSLNFINYVILNSSIKTLEGTPLHMDNFVGNDAIEGHLKTLIDFFMLANSDTVYFLKAESMYSSGFSKYAAMVGGTKFERLDV